MLALEERPEPRSDLHRAGEGRHFVGRPEVGDFLRESYFKPGARYPWPELVLRATGKPLDPVHFVEAFV